MKKDKITYMSDNEHLVKTLEYIKNNPLKAGLGDSKERFYFNEEVEL